MLPHASVLLSVVGPHVILFTIEKNNHHSFVLFCFFFFGLTVQELTQWQNFFKKKKFNEIPIFNIYHILYFVDKLSPSISNIITIVILLGKCHIHCSKWRGNKPSFHVL